MHNPSPDAIGAELARRSLLSFAQRMELGFEDPPHIRLLVDLLEKLERGDIRRLCVSMPPRFGKSTICSMLFPAWAIGRDPRRAVVVSNHSSELANGFSRKTKQYVESNLWPFRHIEMSEDSRATHRWNVTPGGGGLFSVGVNSGLTGIGMDFGLCDDPINDALSQSERDLAWQWFREIFTPRQNAGAKLLVVSARLAQDDIPGRLMESDDAHEWRFVSLPAINEEGNELGLEPGKPLWDRFDKKELAQRREAMGLAAFQSQYMQAPDLAAGGHIFKISDFPTYEVIPTAKAKPWGSNDILSALGYDNELDYARTPSDTFIRVSAVDCAGLENISTGGSWHCILTLLSNLTTGEHYILDVERWRNCEYETLRANIIRHLERNGPISQVIFESNDATGGRLLGDLSRSTHFPCKGVKPKTKSKVERALLVCGIIEANKVHLPARAVWLDAFKAELAAFGHGARFSDQVDAMVWALLGSQQRIAARIEDDLFEQSMKNFSLFGR